MAIVVGGPGGGAPPAHKASHATGGTDALAPSDIGAVPTTQRGPLGGLVALGTIASGATVTPDAAFGTQFTGTAAAGGFTLAAANNATAGQIYAVLITASGANRTVTFAAASITPLVGDFATTPATFTILSGKLGIFLLRAKTATTATLLSARQEV